MSLVLESGGSSEACAKTANLCSEGVDPEFTEEPVCETTYETQEIEYCEQEQQCTQSADLGDGVTATLNDWQYTWCQETGSAWECSCYGNNGQILFELPGDSSVSCADASNICQEATEVEPDGPIECERSYQSAGPSYCSAELGCTQSATVGDVEVGLYGSIWTNCEMIDEGTFHCYCQSGSDSADFEVQSDDAWDTCSGAVESCQELVDVQIGQGGGGYPGPIARPGYY
jgi:hypothetical protein